MESRECAPDDVQLRDELLSRDSGLKKKQTLIIYFKNCKIDLKQLLYCLQVVANLKFHRYINHTFKTFLETLFKSLGVYLNI